MHDGFGILPNEADHLQPAATFPVLGNIGNRPSVAVSLEGADAVPLGFGERRADIVRSPLFAHMLIQDTGRVGISVERIGAEDQPADAVFAQRHGGQRIGSRRSASGSGDSGRDLKKPASRVHAVILKSLLRS
jgi:hypothetical protein